MISTSHSLVRRLRDPNDADAWARFVHLYAPLLMDWAKKGGLTDDEASDVIQDAFVRLLRALPSFTYDPDRSFRGYLNTVLHHCWIDHCRKRSSQLRPGTLLGRGDRSDGVDRAPEIEEEEYRQSLLRRSLALVEPEFSPKIWRGFYLTVVEGRTPLAVANELGTTVNAIYLGRARVLRRLREVLQDLLE